MFAKLKRPEYEITELVFHSDTGYTFRDVTKHILSFDIEAFIYNDDYDGIILKSKILFNNSVVLNNLDAFLYDNLNGKVEISITDELNITANYVCGIEKFQFDLYNPIYGNVNLNIDLFVVEREYTNFIEEKTKVIKQPKVYQRGRLLLLE